MRRLAALVVLLLTAAHAPAQTARRALTAGNERYLLADFRGALPLLVKGLDPKAGSLDRAWFQGIERLADVFLVLRQDSLAATWLRWASRLDPDFQVDEEVVPPGLTRAARAARAFADSTPPDRFVALVTFDWRTASANGPGTVRLDRASIPITARVGTDQFLRGGELRSLPAGSYNVVVSAPGYLPTRLTVEVLPGVTTLVAVSLLPETAGFLYVVARPWASVFVDGGPIGFSSVAAHRVAPGPHVLRLQYQGAARKDTTIVVGERETVRLSWVEQRDTTGDDQLDRALAVLDDADMERGAVLLRQWLSADAAGVPEGMHALVLARLADVAWSLGLKDSAGAYLRSLVQADAFYSIPPGLFNPELDANYVRVRRETGAIAIRAPHDTVLTPIRDSFPIRIAVGRPGEVRLVLRLTRPRSRDSLLVARHVDSVGVARIPLTTPDGNGLAPGQYAIEAQVGGSSDRSSSALLELTVERLPVDTASHQAPISAADFRPETRKQGPSLRTVGEGVGLGALTLGVSAAVNDASLSGSAVPPGAWLIGGSVTLANIAFNRPRVPIPENVAYNEALRRQWNEAGRVIAAENATRLGTAPLRIRVTRAQ